MAARTSFRRQWRPDIEIFLVLCVSSFCVGSLTPEGLALATLSMVPLLWKAGISKKVFEERDARFAFVWLGAILALDVWVSLPLPHGLLAWISPQTAQVWAGALGPLDESISWHSISLEPYGSLLDAARVLLYVAFFAAIRAVVRTSGGGLRIERAVMAATTLLALMALIHPALGAQRIFGIYMPESARGIRISPLLNPNHLAAYLTPGVLLALQHTQERRPIIPKVHAWIALVICGLTMAYAGSRGGTLALAIGAVGLLLTRRSRKQHISRASRWRAIGVLAVVLSLFLVVATVVPQVGAELTETDVTKFQIWAESARLVPAYKSWGVGRGAFLSAVTGVAGIRNNESPTHPENLVLQLLTEYGWLWGVAILAAGAWLLRPSVFARAERGAAWAYWAAVALVLHDMADYALEVPAVSLLLVLCGARYLPFRAVEPKPATIASTLSVSPPGAMVVPGLLCAAAPVLALFAYWTGSHAPARALRDAHVEIANGDQKLSETRVRQLAKEHPANAYLALLGAVSEPQLGSDRAISWAGRALTLASDHGKPTYGRAHAVLAAHLRIRNPRQALLEYSHALSEDTGLDRTVTPEVLGAIHNGEDLRSVLPPDAPIRAQYLSNWTPSLSRRLPASVDRERTMLGEVATKNPSLLAGIAREAIQDARVGAPWCGPRGTLCATEAVRALLVLQRKSPDACEAPGLLVELTEGTAHYGRASEAAENAYPRSINKDACAQQLIRSYARQHDVPRFDHFVTAMRRWPCLPDRPCVSVLVEAAQQDAQLGRRDKALIELKRIQREVSDAPPIIEATASLAASLGLHAEAGENYRRLSTRIPGRADYAARANEEEQLAKTQRLAPHP